jgi:phosphoglycolate phosphatase
VRLPRPPGPFRLLVFDWDGTLMDSIGSIVACTEATLAELGLAPVAAGTIRGAVGLSIRDTVELLQPGSDEAAADRLMAAFRRHWFATYRDLPVLFPGAAPALAALAAVGYLLAIATGKSRRGLAHDLASTGVGHLFHGSRTADEAEAKPHPRMLLDLLDELGARPRETLVVGDSRWDLEMAAAARTPAVAVSTGAHRREELAEYAPLAILDGIGELPGWLRRYGRGR